jgi:hypothetical protein
LAHCSSSCVPDLTRRRAVTAFATRFFRTGEYARRAIAVLLKRELSQRFRRLDVAQAKTDRPAATIVMRVER